MRVLLDECLPRGMVGVLSGHAVTTVSQMGWAGIKNGKLLLLVSKSEKFDAFITVDKNLPFQNRSANHPFAIVVLRSKTNRLRDLRRFGPEILEKNVHLYARSFLHFDGFVTDGKASSELTSSVAGAN